MDQAAAGALRAALSEDECTPFVEQSALLWRAAFAVMSVAVLQEAHDFIITVSESRI